MVRKNDAYSEGFQHGWDDCVNKRGRYPRSTRIFMTYITHGNDWLKQWKEGYETGFNAALTKQMSAK